MQEGQEQQSFLREGAEALGKLRKGLARWELQRLLGGEYDKGNATISIQVASCAVLSYGIQLLFFFHVWVQ